MTDYPTRDELDEQHTWDLTRIYATPDDWAAARDDLSGRVDELHDRTAPTDSPAALAASLDAVETALVAKSRLTLYARLRRNEDTTDDERRDRYRRSQRLAADVDEAVQAVRRRIHRDADAAREYRDAPALDGWRDYLDDLLAQAPHTLDADAEGIVAAFEPVVESQSDTVLAVTTGDVEAPTVEGPDGEPFTVDRGSLREALDSPDREFRRRAHTAFFDALGHHEHALAAAVARKADAHAALAEARDYDSVREMALSRASYPDTGMHVSFPEATHDAVVEQVRAHRGAYHDLLESRRDCLGVETLRPWDERAPLRDATGDPPALSYEEVREHVLAAVEPLGAAYRDRLAAFLDERRVDVYPTDRKRTDIPAYCPSSPETGAFVLANFRHDLRTAFFLAHELGHAMHVELMRDARPPRYVNSPQPVSEVPSLVHELLLADHLLAAGDPALAPHVRERRAEFLAGNVFRAGRSAAFHHDVYRTAADGGDLTPDRLAALYADHDDAFRGPRAPHEAGWRRQSYAREPYHSYQYVTGTVAAVSVHRRVRSGDLSPDAYLEFLRNTGRRDSESSFASLGVDVTASDPYDRVAEELDRVGAARPD